DRVEPPVLGHRQIDHRLDVGFARNVGMNVARRAAVRRNLVGELAAAIVVDVGEHDAGLLEREQPRRGLSDSTCRARNDRDLPFESCHVSFKVAHLENGTWYIFRCGEAAGRYSMEGGTVIWSPRRRCRGGAITRQTVVMRNYVECR